MYLSIKQFNNIFKATVDMFYPRICHICTKGLEQDEEVICTHCFQQFEPTNKKNWVNELTHSQHISEAFSGWYFNDHFQRLIHSMKYSDSAKLGFVLGSMLGQLLENNVKKQVDLLIPVPLHSMKIRQRGYNQAQWITRGLAKQWNLDYKSDLLIRHRPTVSQTTLDSSQRLKNMADAFQLRKPIPALRIGVVDDILTTGATISACGKALESAGSKAVIAITCGTPKLE